jgi:hypothetical protein
LTEIPLIENVGGIGRERGGEEEKKKGKIPCSLARLHPVLGYLILRG